MNLSSEQGNLGTAIVTNLRFVWYAKLAQNFNVTIPYSQIHSTTTRVSKFGNTMILKTHPGYVLGFLIEPSQRLKETFELLNNSHKVNSTITSK